MPDRRPAPFASRTRPGMRLPAAGPTPDQPARWRIVNQTGDGPAELWLYDAIGEDFFGFGVNAEALCRDIADLAADEILLRVNSPGGDYFDGIAIYNALVQHPARVTAQVDGLAASAASFIIQAANKVTMGRGSRVMIHDAIGVCVGNAADMEAMTETLDSISADVADLYHAHAGGGAKAWRERMRAEQWYSADESVAAGLADEVMPAPKKRGQSQDGQAAAAVDWQVAASWDLSSVFRYPDRGTAPAVAAASSEPEPTQPRIVGEPSPELALPPDADAPADPPEAPVAVEEPEPVADVAVPDSVPAASPVVAADAPGSPGVLDHPGEPGTDPGPELAAPEPAAAAEPEPVVASARTFPGSQPAHDSPAPEPAPADLDPWAALTQHLVPPRPATTVDQLLAALRGAP